MLAAATTTTGSSRAGSTARLQTEPPASSASSSGSRRDDAGPLAAALAERAAPARVQLAYPGVWLRDDVYAHPRPLRRPAHDGADVRAPRRRRDGALGRPAARRRARRADDYEAALAPLYAWMHALTQRSEHTVRERRRGRVGARLGGAGRRRAPPPPAARRRARRRLPRRGRRRSTRSASARSSRDLSGAGAAPRLPARHPRGAARGSDVSAPHVIWGHSHRSGPWPGDDPPSGRRAAGARIVNTGSWVYQPHFLSAAAERLALLAGHRGRWSRTRARRELIRLLGGPRPRGARRHARREAGGVARSTPSPTSSSSSPTRVARVLDQREAAGLVDRERAAVDAHRRPRRRPPPTRRRPRTGRSRRRAGPRSGPAAARPARPRAGAAASGSRSTPSSSWISRSVSVVGALAVVQRVQRAVAGPTGSAPASPRCRRSPTARAARRSPPGTGSPSRSTARAHVRRRRARARSRRCGSPITRRPSSGVALVPGPQVRERAQRVDAAEVPELDQHRPAALLVHPQRRDVDPRQVARERRRGDGAREARARRATLAAKPFAAVGVCLSSCRRLRRAGVIRQSRPRVARCHLSLRRRLSLAQVPDRVAALAALALALAIVAVAQNPRRRSTSDRHGLADEGRHEEEAEVRQVHAHGQEQRCRARPRSSRSRSTSRRRVKLSAQGPRRSATLDDHRRPAARRLPERSPSAGTGISHARRGPARPRRR